MPCFPSMSEVCFTPPTETLLDYWHRNKVLSNTIRSRATLQANMQDDSLVSQMISVNRAMHEPAYDMIAMIQ